MKVNHRTHRNVEIRLFQLLVFAFLISAFVTASVAQTSATWQVSSYDLAVTLPTAETAREMNVRAKLELKNVSARPASSLTLRISPNATVSAVSLNGTNADFTKAEDGNLQRIAVRVPSVAAGGTLSAIVDYKIALKDNTGVSMLSAAGSQFLPTSYWYPTPNSWFFPRGADHAPVRIQVTGSGKPVVSSGVEASGAFDQKLAVQPFFTTGNWTTANLSGISVLMPSNAGTVEQKRAAELAELASEAKSFYATLLGAAPATPIRIVSVARGAGFQSGGTILVSNAVFARARIDSGTALSISEAIAKMWIGEATSVSGDGYGVIREGLTRHMANLFLEQKYGKEIADMERTRQRIAYAAISKRDSPLNMVSPVDDFYFPAVANKGAMIWRLLSKRLGQKVFFDTIAANARGGSLSLTELRSAFATQKELLDQMLDQNTDANLLAGLPQVVGGETKIALRNTGTGDATVDVAAILDNGERMSASTTVRAASFGEVIFRTARKIIRVEIDTDKLYPQTEYSDDVAPRETTDTDLLLAVKRDFDRQAFAEAEKTARTVLRYSPRFDDVRILLARSLLGQNKIAEAEKEFTAVRDEKLPTARSLAWAAVGLADVASRGGREADAIRYAAEAIKADGELGAGLAARNVRNKFNKPSPIDESIKTFFTRFDQAAISNRKADLDALVVPGEVTRFVGGISGGTTQWKSDLRHADIIDADHVLVEAAMTVRLLNREVETGMAVYKLTRVAGNWKLSGVEIFEVR
jgi:tetratricopeptide (TPR) repeat protein